MNMENQTKGISNWVVLLVDNYFMMNTKSLRDRTAHTGFPELGKSVTPLSKWENTKQCCRRMMCLHDTSCRHNVNLTTQFEHVHGKNRIWNMHSDARRVSSTVTMPRMLHVLVFSFRLSSMCTHTWEGLVGAYFTLVKNTIHTLHTPQFSCMLMGLTKICMYVHVFKNELTYAQKWFKKSMLAHDRNRGFSVIRDL